MRGVTLRNIDLTYGGIGDEPKADHHLLENLAKIPECARNYPESKMFGVLPAWGLYVRHVDGLIMENVTLRVSESDYRACLVADDAKNLTLDNWHIHSAGREPVMVFHNVKTATLRHCKPPTGTQRFSKLAAIPGKSPGRERADSATHQTYG